jgi:hypothetical protein
MSRAKLSGACMIVLTIAIASSSALAATATLSIPYRNCVGGDGRIYDYTLRVSGTTRYYPDGMRVEVRLWGDDSYSDDFLSGPFISYYEEGSSYFVEFCVNKSTLDEDLGEDEIYAGVRVYDRATGSLRETVESNRIHDYF